MAETDLVEQEMQQVDDVEVDGGVDDDAEQPKQKPHDFDKGLSKVQQKFNTFQRETNDTLKSILAKLDSNTQPTKAEANAVDEIEDFLSGRDPDDVPSMKDFSRLMQVVAKATKGPDVAAVTKAVRDELEPLLETARKGKEEVYWSKFFGQHPTLDQPMVNELWSKAADMADEGGAESDQAVEAATRAHFQHLVASKERSLKRTTEKGSTASPKSTQGAKTIHDGASATTPTESGKKTREDMYRDLDSDGKL